MAVCKVPRQRFFSVITVLSEISFGIFDKLNIEKGLPLCYYCYELISKMNTIGRWIRERLSHIFGSAEGETLAENSQAKGPDSDETLESF